jgi:hypothetical protein
VGDCGGYVAARPASHRNRHAGAARRVYLDWRPLNRQQMQAAEGQGRRAKGEPYPLSPDVGGEAPRRSRERDSVQRLRGLRSNATLCDECKVGQCVAVRRGAFSTVLTHLTRHAFSDVYASHVCARVYVLNGTMRQMRQKGRLADPSGDRNAMPTNPRWLPRELALRMKPCASRRLEKRFMLSGWSPPFKR